MSSLMNTNKDGEIANPYRVFIHTPDGTHKFYYLPIIPRIGEIINYSGNKTEYKVARIEHTYIINDEPSDFQTDINIYADKIN